ncbi:hypothetical protein A6X20_17425 [Bradyrhizobium elkanii]|nr:hypothetical protein A6X20_17425 [Bradyrhizobium elkanii]ODM85335.1 hypothetical protein A6452_12000 [Bradyrhizobium elkanii]
MWFGKKDFVEGIPELMLQVVEDIPTDASESIVSLDEDAERTFGMTSRAFDSQSRQQIDDVSVFSVEQLDGIASPYPAENMLDVGRRIAGPAGPAATDLQLAARHDDAGGIGEKIGLARVIDVKMGVDDHSNVGGFDASRLKLDVERTVDGIGRRHTDGRHDFRRTEAGIDENRPDAQSVDQEGIDAYRRRRTGSAVFRQE